MTVKNDLIYREGESLAARSKFEGCFDQGKDPRGFQRVHKVELINDKRSSYLFSYLLVYVLVI